MTTVKHDQHTSTALSTEYTTRKELAALLNKSERTLDNWATRGFGPPRISINGSHLYRRDKLRDWLDSHERGGEAA